MQPELRSYFDLQLDHVLRQLPAQIHSLLEEVPLIIDDYPTPELCRKLKVRGRDTLCGLYTGIPLSGRSIHHSGVPSDVIHIFRQGICRKTIDTAGHLDEDELKRQIRITILHEIGHHFGFDEDELTRLGYG